MLMKIEKEMALNSDKAKAKLWCCSAEVCSLLYKNFTHVKFTSNFIILISHLITLAEYELYLFYFTNCGLSKNCFGMVNILYTIQYIRTLFIQNLTNLTGSNMQKINIQYSIL